jgi:uncharacterized protein YndB with AHSA1/START domain
LTVVDKPEGRKGAGRRFIQRAPDGDELGSDGEYREIVPNERIVVTFRFEGMPPGHGAMQTALREERERKTAPRVALLCRTVADGDGRLKSGMVPDRRKL